MSGARIATSRPSTPARVASVASLPKAAMNSGRQSGISGIVDRVHAEMNLAGIEHLGPRQGQRQHDGVAGGNVGDGNAGGGPGGHGDGPIRECRAADVGQIDTHHTMLAHAETARDGGRGVELDFVALTVGHRQGVTLETLLARQARAPSRNRVRRTATPPRASPSVYFPGMLPQSTLCSWSWKRTGNRSARIQSASCRAGNCSALGENNTLQRVANCSVCSFSRLHS